MVDIIIITLCIVLMYIGVAADKTREDNDKITF